MANELVQKHNFELAKGRIQTKLNQVPSSVSLNQFPIDGEIIPFNNHNITGYEANQLLVKPLQETLMKQNTNIKDLFNIANDVYIAIDSLDTEYIAGILAAVRSAETASNQAKQASNQALDASSKALEASQKATTAQTDIKRTIEALQLTVKILNEFKERVSKDFTTLSLVPNQIMAINKNLQSLEQSHESISRATQNVQKASSIINEANHLGDIDAIWDDVEGHKSNLEGLHKQVDGFVAKVNQSTQRIYNDIAALQEYRAQLESHAHLDDIDAIWDDVEGHKSNLEGLHKQVDSFIKETYHTKNVIKKSIDEFVAAQKEKNQQVDKKVKIAYCVGGGSVALSLIHLFLQLLGIL